LLITVVQHFKIFIDIPSYLVESSVLKNFIVLMTTVSVMGVIFISVVLSE